jgi:hypothetical protein
MRRIGCARDWVTVPTLLDVKRGSLVPIFVRSKEISVKNLWREMISNG